MTTTSFDPWSPVGVAGTATVEDALSYADQLHLPARTPFALRARLDVAGHELELSWRHRRMFAAVVEADGTRDLADGTTAWGTDRDQFVWTAQVMPVEVLGEPVTMERRRAGRDRWSWDVRGPGGRAWEWRPAGAVFANRMELTRHGDRRPVVTYDLRPVPGTPRAMSGQAKVSWEASASVAEVVLCVMWVLERAYEGLLPKTQRVVRADVL